MKLKTYETDKEYIFLVGDVTNKKFIAKRKFEYPKEGNPMTIDEMKAEIKLTMKPETPPKLIGEEVL